MSARVVVDPITRIEGHLRIEAQMNGGIIEDAFSSGTMVRGIETIVQGRDPREVWAFSQRICGVCTLVHGLAAVRAVEDALDWKIPPNAELIRNLMVGSQYVHDHVMHFYHLHALDWVDVVSALKADPKATSELAQSIGGSAKSSPGYFSDVLKKLKSFVDNGQLGIFANGYWGHPAYRLPPEANLMALAHYLDALAWQRDVSELHAIFGGRNPHPNMCVGGMPCAISLDSGKQAGTALDVVGLERVRNTIAKMQEFVHQVYVPDTLAIAGYYKDWFNRGEAVGNFMCFGDFPAKGFGDADSYMIPAGVILNRDLSHIEPVDLDAEGEIQEFVSRAWYDYAEGKDAGLHPYKGETEFAYTGPEPPYKQLDVDNQYSWLKSPRWRGKAMEVGPLARMLMLYASGDEQATTMVDSTLAQLELPIDALYSTMGRTAARALETAIMVDALSGWYDNLLANIKAGDTKTFNEQYWDPRTWPQRSQGVGHMEAPRGALGHWIVIEDGKTANYQAVVPSTWMAGPRDAQNQKGPYEAALAGHTLHDPDQPIEILRTIHSFDPCIACAVHLTDPNGEEVLSVNVR
ncbi:MAG: nickel-dependent hydrogenase large subunit [Thiohalocapsa sp.]|jgi:hydrogenase large subunit|nr:nickel-dependent hydrogenase large subunit [Thiohalocapsa sp.]MCF7990978.1 nickel-dependent hydrogenase large subunit [Thiohalocapsa sp.]